MQAETQMKSGEELLAEVAERRDRIAFDQLVRRFEKPAYNLAYYLCHDSELANDAVQEAMIEVWNKAAFFDPSRGSGRSWVIRIVVNKTLQLKTRERRERERAMANSTTQTDLFEKRELQAKDSGELSEALTRSISRLSQVERQVVALYYGAELSQKEISELLKLPPRTVSYRLQQSLESLRKYLTAAGFASVLPLTEAGSLRDAMLDCFQAPPSLHGRIMTRVLDAARQSARVGAATVAKSSFGLWAILALCCGLFLALWFAFMGNEPATRRDPSASVPEETSAQKVPVVVSEPPKAAAPDTPRAGARVLFQDDFSDEGKWTAFTKKHPGFQWSKDGGLDESPCLINQSDRNMLEIEVDEDALPLIVTLRHRPLPAGKNEYGIQGLWLDIENFSPFYNFGKYVNRKKTNFSFATSTIYMTSDLCYTVSDFGTEGLNWFQRKPRSRIGIGITGRQRIDDLLVRTASPEEMPDLQKYREAIEAVPADQRDGRLVALPQLPCMRDGKPVQVKFLNPSSQPRE